MPDDGVLDRAAGVDAAGRVPLGRLLVAQSYLTEAQLDGALTEGEETGERLGEILVRRGLLSEDELAKVLAEQWSLSYVDRASIWFDADALARMSREDAQRLEALPTRVQDGRVVVAVAEPTEQRLDALREVIGDETVVVVVPKSALDAGLSSELLASRGASDASGGVAAPAPFPILDLLSSAASQAATSVERPVPALEPGALSGQPQPGPVDALPPLIPGDVQSLRDRMEKLEAELARQRAVIVEVQLHLQAALRTLLLNEVGRFDDHSNGAGPTP